MGFKYLNVERQQGIERLVLNRPDVRNAFNEGMIAELTWWADSVSSDRAVRLAIIEGAGPVFCAGANIDWMGRMATFSHEQNLDDAMEAARLFAALDRLPVPVIGRVHGAALGGGAGLAAICDIVIAAENAVFGFTEVRLGLIPAVIAPFVMAKIGRSASRELFLTGERFGAARARELGLVHSVVPLAGLDVEVARYRDAPVRAPGQSRPPSSSSPRWDAAARATSRCFAQKRSPHGARPRKARKASRRSSRSASHPGASSPEGLNVPTSARREPR
jgi:methylglutaconyl-CoA hydratase